MKATIDARGGMKLKAEDELESYALAKWYEDWIARKVTLEVEIPHPANPQATTIRRADND